MEDGSAFEQAFPGEHAVPSIDGRKFTLVRPTAPTGTNELPVYLASSGTWIRVLETPFAVAGDTVMVGGVAAVAGFLLWVQSGAPTR